MVADPPAADQQGPVTVLSVDGGGIRGLIPALALERLAEVLAEEAAPQGRRPPDLCSLFDVIAGASTGGLIAIGLAAPARRGAREPLLAPRDLVDLYERRSREIFARRPLGWLSRLYAPSYDARSLEAILEDMLGELRLSDARARLVLPSYDVRRRTAKLFRCDPARPDGGRDYLLKDVARAITAAPIYFRPAVVRSLDGAPGERLVDGAVFANNPALLGYAEASRLARGRPIVVLSIGTGQVNRRLPPGAVRRGGSLGWLDLRRGVPLIDLILDGQVDVVDGALAEVLEPGHSYFRYDPPLPDALSGIDDVRRTNLHALRGLAERTLARHDAALRRLARRLLSRAG